MMIKILKKQNSQGETLYEYMDNEKMNSEPARMLKPPRLANCKVLTCNNWQDKFERGIDNIIDDILDFMSENCSNCGFNCSFNIREIRKEMAYIVYKSSMNRFKYYAALVD